MASPLRNFFLGGEKSKPPRKPSGSDLLGYAKIKPKVSRGGSPDRGLIESVAEGIGKSAVSGGPFGALLRWAKKQTDKDVRKFWWVPVGEVAGEKISVHPVKAPLHPIKTAGELVERGSKGFLKGVAWAMVHGAVIEKNRLEWLAIRDELDARFGSDPVNRELLGRFGKALTEPGFGEETQKISEEMLEMARSRFGPHQDDPVVKRFGSLAESAFERQQFFSGMSDGIGWHTKWKREIFWKGKLPTGHRVGWAPGAVLKRNIVNPLGKSLGKTALGKGARAIGTASKAALRKAWALLKKFGKQTASKLFGLLKKALAKLGLSGATQAVSQAIAQFVALFGNAIAPIVSHLIGFLAGIIIGVAIEWTWKLIKFTQKLTLYSCMTFGMGMVLLSGLIAVTIGGALRMGGTGGPVSAGTEPVLNIVSKTVEPRSISVLDGTVHSVNYTITYENNSEEDAAGVTISDDYDQGNITIVNTGGGADNGNILEFSLGDLGAGESGSVSYTGTVVADVDKVVSNRATIAGFIGGSSYVDSQIGVLIIGNPTGQLPDRWPMDVGCITQGPNTGGSHRGLEAIDISYNYSVGMDDMVYATHDGIAYTYPDSPPWSQAMGNYVVVASPSGFSSVYGHLLNFSVQNGQEVLSGTPVGLMDNTGSVTSRTHLHYHFRGLEMAPPNIPSAVPSCTGRTDCNMCFSCPTCPAN